MYHTPKNLSEIRGTNHFMAVCLKLSAALYTNIVEHNIFLVYFLSLFIIHCHQQLESHFFMKHLQSDTNSLWKLEATVDNGSVLEVMKSCNDQDNSSSSN